ncbi:hypothetical protein N0B16_07815 [Chryseobacterium sp. GMJ5]|uniref:Uncharacterized protein n=1 Tax=Chryseobacterium gilvum TaxID=2976534 RepID=A0ABT2VWG7_9FLAO|nr:hypothetical protein [Chryseobacterium gilvum]MCU7614341.1 hypothetical protein [Chryseobacterium gilvum]
MKNIFLGIILTGIITISCKKDERPTYLKEEAGVQQSNVVTSNASNTSLLNQAGIQNTASAMTTVPGMNPPHGQPGHRCDIPVGQPLNSTVAPQNQAAQKNITVNGNNTIQIDPNSVSPGKIRLDNNGKPVKTAPGMNPPHGEPNHRCDIPVGQPLNSKPAPQQASNQNTAIPAAAPQQVAANGPKPTLNPAHGEPFHDCAKKVGDPL